MYTTAHQYKFLDKNVILVIHLKAREISLSLWLSATDRWFSPGPLVSSTNKTDRHDITEIVLKVALNTIKQTTNYTRQLVLDNSWPTGFIADLQ